MDRPGVQCNQMSQLFTASKWNPNCSQSNRPLCFLPAITVAWVVKCHFAVCIPTAVIFSSQMSFISPAKSWASGLSTPFTISLNVLDAQQTSLCGTRSILSDSFSSLRYGGLKSWSKETFEETHSTTKKTICLCCLRYRQLWLCAVQTFSTQSSFACVFRTRGASSPLGYCC